MNRLLTMIAFTKVVQYGSFTVAATELGVSRALTSRYVADLESHVGVRLINRSTRFVKPTEAGQHYYDFCNRILSDIRTEEERISRGHRAIEGKISVASVKWIGNSEMPEALTAFCAANPGIVCNLSLYEGATESAYFLEHGYDLAILTRSVRESPVRFKKLADISYVLVASPKYLALRGEPSSLRELNQHACLLQTVDHVWSFDNGEHTVALQGSARFTSNTYTAVCRAAVAGLGIALLPLRLAAPHIDSGEVQRVLTQYRPDDRQLSAAFSPVDNPPLRVRTLLDFLSDWFSTHPLH